MGLNLAFKWLIVTYTVGVPELRKTSIQRRSNRIFSGNCLAWNFTKGKWEKYGI